MINIFGESHSVPVMASACLQRWSLTLSSYTYTIKYKSGRNQGNADAFTSRWLPLPKFQVTTPVLAETIASIEHLSSIPLTAAKIRRQTNYDSVLCKVKQYTHHGLARSVEQSRSNRSHAIPL